MTIFIASSKIYFSPSWVRALHSKYLHFVSSSMTLLAVSLSTGASFGFLFLFRYSARRSILFPTKIFRVLGTRFWSSGYHWINEQVLFFERWQNWQGPPQRTQWRTHHSGGKPEVSAYHTHPARPYPWILNFSYHNPRLTILPSTFTVAA